MNKLKAHFEHLFIVSRLFRWTLLVIPVSLTAGSLVAFFLWLLYLDPNWRPHLQTPPFPEYTCGHCTISAAASEALTSVFGNNFAYSDTSELEFGIQARTYSSFRQAAEENEKARFYGGIHYHYCCTNSNRMGRELGNFIVDRLKMKLY